jgi:hypothetical protein
MPTTPSLSFLRELRDTAMNTSGERARFLLQYHADFIQRLIRDLDENPTRSRMVQLNGAWASAERLLALVNNIQPDDPTGGAMRQAAFQQTEVRKAA